MKEIFSQKRIDVGIAIFAWLLALFLNWSLIEATIFAGLIYLILSPLPKSKMVFLTVFVFLMIPILLLSHRSTYANEAAILFYLLLIIIFGQSIIKVFQNDQAK